MHKLNILMIAQKKRHPWNTFDLFSYLQVFIHLGYHFVVGDHTARRINPTESTF